MLRLIFVLIAVIIGTYYTLQGPFYGLLFYIANAYFRPEEWVWSGLVSGLHLSLTVGTYTVLRTLFSGQRLVWNGRIALLWIFLIQTFFSTLYAAHFNYCWPYWVEFLKVIVITYLMIILTTDVAKFRLVVMVMVLALGLEQAKQGWLHMVISPGGPNTNLVSFLGDNNGVAVGMLMLVPLIGMLLESAQTRKAKFFYRFLFVGCLYRALSTYSRGGFLACLAMTGVWLIRFKPKWRGLLVALIIIGIVLPALPSAFWNRMDSINKYEENQDESALSRLHFWQVAVTMADANPVLGIGFNGFNPTYDAYDFSRGQYGRGRSVHSSFFGVLAELGYLGAMLYILIILGALLTCFQVHKKTTGKAGLKDLNRGVLALERSLVAFIVGGSFVPWSYNEMLWHIIGLTLVLDQLAKQVGTETGVSQDQDRPGHGAEGKAQVAA